MNLSNSLNLGMKNCNRSNNAKTAGNNKNKLDKTVCSNKRANIFGIMNQ